MIYAIIENGVIINVIVADAEFAEQIGALPLAERQGIGDTYQAPKPNPTPEEDTAALLIDQEYRITLLELGVNEHAV